MEIRSNITIIHIVKPLANHTAIEQFFKTWYNSNLVRSVFSQWQTCQIRWFCNPRRFRWSHNNPQGLFRWCRCRSVLASNRCMASKKLLSNRNWKCWNCLADSKRTINTKFSTNLDKRYCTQLKIRDFVVDAGVDRTGRFV